MNVGFDRKGAMVVASKDIEGYAGDQVDFRVEANICYTALAFMSDCAV